MARQFRRLAYWIGLTLIAAFLLFPLLAIIPMSFTSGRYLEFPPAGFSFRWYENFFASQAWRTSLRVSIEVGILTTVMSLAIGVPAAFSFVRMTARFARTLAGSLYALPVIFPVIVSAVALYHVFAPLQLVGTRIGLAVSHTILALPVVIFPVAATLSKIDRQLEWQALSLGASKFHVLRTVLLPILRPTLLSVGTFSFITSFDELVFALFLSDGRTMTVPKRIWEGIRFEIEPTTAVIASLGLALSTCVVITSIIRHVGVADHLGK